MRYLVNGSRLTDIGDAIREKTGVSGTMTLSEMPSAIRGIQGGGVSGDDATLRTLVDGTVTSISCNCETVRPYAFAYCPALTTVSLPACESIGSYAFSGCSHLMSVDLTGCSSAPQLGTSAFYRTPMTNSGYTGEYGSIYVPFRKYYAFVNASNWSLLTSRIVSSGGYEIHDTITLAIPDNAYSNDGSLRAAAFTAASVVGENAFYGCVWLSSVSLPACTTIGEQAFAECGLLSIALPACTYIGDYAFDNSSLRVLDLTSVSSVPTLGRDVFWRSQPELSIYVPSSLYGTFVTAIGWSLISSRIASV